MALKRNADIISSSTGADRLPARICVVPNQREGKRAGQHAPQNGAMCVAARVSTRAQRKKNRSACRVAHVTHLMAFAFCNARIKPQPHARSVRVAASQALTQNAFSTIG
jgi:hypothetical protein